MQALLLLKCAAVWTLVLLILPLPVLLLTISFIWQMVLWGYRKIFHPNLMKCNPKDKSVYSFSETNDPPHGFSFRLAGQVYVEDFFTMFLEQVIDVNDVKNCTDPHIRFYQSAVELGGELFFKTHENILFENHVHSLAIQNDANRLQSITNWIATPLKTNCPSWGMLFLRVEESNEVTFVFKLQHVLGDGYSLLHIMDLLTNTKYKYLVKDFEDTAAEKAQMTFEFPYRYLELSKQLGVIGNERNYFSTQLSGGYFMATISLPLPQLKEIRRKANVKFASVMMYLLKSAFNSHILATKEPVESFFIGYSLSWPNHPKTKLTNHACGGFTRPFKINSKEVSLEELMEVDKEYQAFHRKYFNRIVNWSTDVLRHFPVVVNKKVIDNYAVCRNATFHYSHMVGSENYDNLLGSVVKDVSMFGFPHHKAAWIYGLTTNNEVKLTMMGPKRIEFEPDKFFISVKDSLELLLSSSRGNNSEGFPCNMINV